MNIAVQDDVSKYDRRGRTVKEGYWWNMMRLTLPGVRDWLEDETAPPMMPYRVQPLPRSTEELTSLKPRKVHVRVAWLTCTAISAVKNHIEVTFTVTSF